MSSKGLQRFADRGSGFLVVGSNCHAERQLDYLVPAPQVLEAVLIDQANAADRDLAGRQFSA
jgi:hypothetical protein